MFQKKCKIQLFNKKKELNSILLYKTLSLDYREEKKIIITQEALSKNQIIVIFTITDR
jgi:hypothetical protein